jgi:hypothetical protein
MAQHDANGLNRILVQNVAFNNSFIVAYEFLSDQHRQKINSSTIFANSYNKTITQYGIAVTQQMFQWFHLFLIRYMFRSLDHPHPQYGRS